MFCAIKKSTLTTNMLNFMRSDHADGYKREDRPYGIGEFIAQVLSGGKKILVKIKYDFFCTKRKTKQLHESHFI